MGTGHPRPIRPGPALDIRPNPDPQRVWRRGVTTLSRLATCQLRRILAKKPGRGAGSDGQRRPHGADACEFHRLASDPTGLQG